MELDLFLIVFNFIFFLYPTAAHPSTVARTLPADLSAPDFPVSIANVTADGINVFYRYAGDENGPPFLLLHGVPSSSHQYRNIIPLLAKAGFRVIAPDMPGFGFTQVPASRNFTYSFANLATTMLAFIDVLEIEKFAGVYVFDYGAPTAFRIALQRPDLWASIVSQNGNAYVAGLGPAWSLVQEYWATGSKAARTACLQVLSFQSTMEQYTNGSAHPWLIQPEGYWLDQSLMDRPGNMDIQLDLYYDYRNNVAMYPQFQEYFRTSNVPVLALWGQNDQFFIPAGAEAYAADVKTFELHWFDAGHYALDTNEIAMASYIDEFIKSHT